MSKLLNSEAVAEILGVTAKTVKGYACSGRLRCVRLSHKVLRFRPADVEAFVDGGVDGEAVAAPAAEMVCA